MSTQNNNLMEMLKTHTPQGLSVATTSFIKEARGAIMVDEEGRELIDFAGGIGVLNVGHSHPKVVAALHKQADKFQHTCFHIAPYKSYVELAAKLNELAPGNFSKKTMLVNSGVEAVENAIKIARYYTGRSAVITFENSFHGRTNLGMTLTSKVKPYKYGLGPAASEIYRMPYAYCYRCPVSQKHPECKLACADLLEDFFITNVAAEKVAAIIVEPVQGEGGFITPPPGYFNKLHEICKKHGILFIADEIQSGMGRTGKIFAMDHWGVEADIITTAKSLAAGMPLSAVTGRAEIMDSVHVGGLGSTYGGNPLACSAALAVLEVLTEDGLLEKAEVLGSKLLARFQDMKSRYDIIGDVRGKGPMLALELVRDRETKEPAADEVKKLTQLCYEKGLVLISCGNYGNVIRTLMPLVISDEQLEQGLKIIEESFQELTR